MAWLPKDRVVVPVDFSEDSLEAMDTSLELVADPSHLYFIHVLLPLSPLEPGVVWGTIDDDGRRQHAEEALRATAGSRFQGAHFEVTFGDPGHEIVSYIERVDADLVIMPSHGRTGAKRVLMGSVAERVVRLAQCPVLVLKRTRG